jgi:hypothetical protein
MIDMAIIKATFTKSQGAAKANIRYISHRPASDGTKAKRELWTSDGTISPKQAYQLIDDASPNTTYYRLALSPDPKREDGPKDLRLRLVTESMMQLLDDRFNASIPWVAATHENHSPHRHVHILALLPRKLTRDDLLALRTQATEVCQQQRLERDAVIKTRQATKQAAWELERS